MEEKKSILELLDAKSALLIGLVGGVLCLGTLGFIVLGTLVLQGKVSIGSKADSVAVAGNTAQPSAPAAAQNQTPPQTNIPKTAKPKVELFVMSYCPYGLQMEKAFLPAWDLLKNKADLSIKYVNYAMHGKKEIDENTRQFCILKDQPTKYSAYLKCFFAAGQNNGAEADYGSCLKQAGVNESSLNSCVGSTDKQFGITAKFNDQASWLSGQFPQYPIHDSENTKYGVQGSPTLVINGVQSQAARTPEAIKQAICAAFDKAPAECSQPLNNSSFQAGFGLAQAGTAGATAPGCGT
ncbi:MAG: hypothetical protein AAB467_01345 [Patescibacteria group bacterium]